MHLDKDGHNLPPHWVAEIRGMTTEDKPPIQDVIMERDIEADCLTEADHSTVTLQSALQQGPPIIDTFTDPDKIVDSI